MTTRANRRVLDLIWSDQGPRQAIIDAPNSESRKQILADRFKLPLGNDRKLSRARDFFWNYLDTLVSFNGVPRIYFPLLSSDESIAHFQEAVRDLHSDAEATYLRDMDDLRARTALAMGSNEELQKALEGMLPEERASKLKELESIHQATLAVFENHLTPGKIGGFTDASSVSILLGSRRAAPDRDILELSHAALVAIEKTTHGKRLRDMVLSNAKIRNIHNGEENMAITTTNYSVPAANYWRWNFGSASPVRIPTLSADDIRSAREIWNSSRQRSLECPWVELEG